jgi:hypothetical protein
MEVQQTSGAQPLIQDGGKCLNIKIHLLQTKKEKCWRFKAMLMLRIEILKQETSMAESINNGTSSMQMNGKENQERENSTRSSDSMLREISMLFLNCQRIDT